MVKVLNIFTSSLRYDGICMSNLNYYNNISNKIEMDYLAPNKVDDTLKHKFTTKGNKIFELYYKDKKMHRVKPIMYCKKLYHIIKEEKYDIVHVHGSSSMLFLQLLTAKMAGVKIRIAHSRNTEAGNNLIHYLFKPLFNMAYNVAFACGKDAGKWLFGNNKKVTIIPNGKDSKMFRFNSEIRKKVRKEYNLNNKIVLGHVGNFNFQKNHDFLIEVFYKLCQKNNNFILMLVGTGELEEKIKEKAFNYKLEDKIIFLGQIPNEKIPSLLNSMDIMVFPSKFEGFPNVLIEWQMNGLPCIISDKITKDVKITNLVTFLPIEDATLWAEELVKIELDEREVNNNKIIQEVKEAGYDIFENAKMLEEKYMELYKKYIDNY